MVCCAFRVKKRQFDLPRFQKKWGCLIVWSFPPYPHCVCRKHPWSSPSRMGMSTGSIQTSGLGTVWFQVDLKVEILLLIINFKNLTSCYLRNEAPSPDIYGTVWHKCITHPLICVSLVCTIVTPGTEPRSDPCSLRSHPNVRMGGRKVKG